jgi:hypothetical protein
MSSVLTSSVVDRGFDVIISVLTASVVHQTHGLPHWR